MHVGERQPIKTFKTHVKSRLPTGHKSTWGLLKKKTEKANPSIKVKCVLYTKTINLTEDKLLD